MMNRGGCRTPEPFTMRQRQTSGTSLVETPFVLWIILVGIIMPMICFAAIGLRYAFFMNAARQAVHAATQAKSFHADYPPDLSVETLAKQTAETSCKSFSGVLLNSVAASIVETPVKGGEPKVHQTKLSYPADEESNLYQIRVTLAGSLTPLVPIPSGVLGISVPGLTAPYPITTSVDEVCENTQGLNR